jgi:hypothetical protein
MSEGPASRLRPANPPSPHHEREPVLTTHAFGLTTASGGIDGV